MTEEGRDVSPRVFLTSLFGAGLDMSPWWWHEYKNGNRNTQVIFPTSAYVKSSKNLLATESPGEQSLSQYRRFLPIGMGTER